MNVLQAAHLVDGEANGLHVLSDLSHFATVLLDQTHNEAASHFIISRIIILLLQLDQKLRVHPERVCREQNEGQTTWLLL